MNIHEFLGSMLLDLEDSWTGRPLLALGVPHIDRGHVATSILIKNDLAFRPSQGRQSAFITTLHGLLALLVPGTDAEIDTEDVLAWPQRLVRQRLPEQIWSALR